MSALEKASSQYIQLYMSFREEGTSLVNITTFEKSWLTLIVPNILEHVRSAMTSYPPLKKVGFV